MNKTHLPPTMTLTHDEKVQGGSHDEHSQIAGDSRPLSRSARRSGHGLAWLSQGALLLSLVAVAGCSGASGDAGAAEHVGSVSSASNSGTTVMLYTNTSYGGSSQSLSPGVYNLSTLTGSGGIGNDTLSSLKIPSGWTVRLYADQDWSGSSLKLTEDTSNLISLSFNDMTSSLVVQGSGSDGTGKVILFKNADYSGSAQALSAGSYDVSSLSIGNDALSSMMIPSNLSATIYVDSGYSGGSTWFVADVHDLSTFGWNDRASSIKITTQ